MSIATGYVRPSTTREERAERQRTRPRGGLHADRRTRRQRTRAAATDAALRDWQ